MKIKMLLFFFAFYFISCESLEMDDFLQLQNEIQENFQQLTIDESGFVKYDFDWPNGNFCKFDIAEIQFSITIEEEGSEASYCFNSPCPETILIWLKCKDQACIGDKPYDEKWFNYRGVIAFNDIEYGLQLYDIFIKAQKHFTK